MQQLEQRNRNGYITAGVTAAFAEYHYTLVVHQLYREHSTIVFH
jgi:hypothetical protein